MPTHAQVARGGRRKVQVEDLPSALNGHPSTVRDGTPLAQGRVGYRIEEHSQNRNVDHGLGKEGST